MLNKKEDINFRQLIFKLKDWLKYLASKWVMILTCCFAAALLGFTWGYFQDPTYNADETFVLSSNSKSNGLAALAGQLGYDFGSNSDDIFAGDNIIELFKSNRIIKGALFKKLPNSNKTLLSLFIEENKLNRQWLKIERIRYSLPFPDSAEKLNAIQDSLISEIHELIVKKYINVDKVDKKLSIYRIGTISTHPNLAFYLTKFVLDEASNFYINTRTKTAKLNLNMLQHEADSLRTLLANTITNTGDATDEIYNLNPAHQVQRSTTQQGQISITVLSAAYAEVVKNLEIAKISLQKETPLYQVIDEPDTLLKKQKTSKLLSAIKFALATSFGVLLFLVIKRAFSIS